MKLIAGLILVAFLLAACGGDAMTGGVVVDVDEEVQNNLEYEISILKNSIADKDLELADIKAELITKDATIKALEASIIEKEKLISQQKTVMRELDDECSNNDELNICEEELDALKDKVDLLQTWVDSCEKYLDGYVKE